MNRISVSEIPDEMKRRLSTERIPALGRVFVPAATSSFRSYLFIGIALAWLIALFSTAYDLRWGTFRLASVAVVSVVVIYFAVRGVLSILGSRNRQLPEGLIVDDRNAFLIGPTSVECWSLGELVSVDCVHKYQDRRYLHSDLRLLFTETQRNIRVNNLDEAEDVADRVSELRKYYLQAAAKGTLTDLAGSEFSSPAGSRDHFRVVAGRLAAAVAAVGLGALAAGSAYGLNEYFDDKLSWDYAVSGGRASSFRQYLRTHPGGRWYEPASGCLNEFYDQAETRYRAALGPDHDPEAVAALLAMLKYARSTHNYRLDVRFHGTADIPEDLPERIKEEFDVKKVLPLGSTFGPERMAGRESALLEVIDTTFRQLFPEDVIEITTDCGEECSVFSVAYETSFLESIYYDLKEKDIPREERNWSPGILINWKFKLSIPNESREYEFELDSAPADTINYDTDAAGPIIPTGTDPTSSLDQESFYDAMVNSAFDDFKQHLLFNLGMGPEPHLNEAESN